MFFFYYRAEIWCHGDKEEKMKYIAAFLRRKRLPKEQIQSATVALPLAGAPDAFKIEVQGQDEKVLPDLWFSIVGD